MQFVRSPFLSVTTTGSSEWLVAGKCYGVQYYFIESPELFDRQELYGPVTVAITATMPSALGCSAG